MGVRPRPRPRAERPGPGRRGRADPDRARASNSRRVSATSRAIGPTKELAPKRSGTCRCGTAPSVALRPDDAAAGGGNADRAAAIGAERERPHAGRDRHRRAAAEPPQVWAWLSGIERPAEERAFGEGLVAELRRGRLADQDRRRRPGRARPRPHRRVGHGIGEERRALRGRDALGIGQVLDRERDAVQRAQRLAGHQLRLGDLGFGAGAFGADRHEGVQFGLLLDAGERRFDRLDGRDGPGPDRGSEIDGGEIGDGGHGMSSSDHPAAAVDQAASDR